MPQDHKASVFSQKKTRVSCHGMNTSFEIIVTGVVEHACPGSCPKVLLACVGVGSAGRRAVSMGREKKNVKGKG
jgi:hypothetical protein